MFLFVASFFAVTAHGKVILGPVVQTLDGPIQGRQTSSTDKSVSYLGVPFAEPPLGKLRFALPQRPVPWTKVKKMIKKAKDCTQVDVIKGQHLGAEDCLYLQVHVPEGCTPDTPCPVMQWIFGGGWMVGSSTGGGIPGIDNLYDGLAFAKANKVIVVQGNYRLDVLGFLSHAAFQDESEGGKFGNYGLFDQTAAMKWTNKNIGVFGGDPNRVTIFGESAGGVSVCQHLVLPASDGLFSSAIMESGLCDGTISMANMDAGKMKRFGAAYVESVGCSGASAADVRDCMRRKPLRQIMLPFVGPGGRLCPTKYKSRHDFWCEHKPDYPDPPAHLGNTSNATGPGTATDWPSISPPWSPIMSFLTVVDGSPTGLPDTPMNLIQQGRINRSPTGAALRVVVGTNNDEGALFYNFIGLMIPGVGVPLPPLAREFTDGGFRTMVNWAVAYRGELGWGLATRDAFLERYPASDYRTGYARYAEWMTDYIFRCDSLAGARGLAAAGVETYYFNYNYHHAGWLATDDPKCAKGPLEGVGLARPLRALLKCGVPHSSELKPLWAMGAGKADAGERAMTATMQRYWRNVAYYGTPNGDAARDANSTVGVRWPRYDAAGDYAYLDLAVPSVARTNLRKEHCGFWSSLNPTWPQY